MYPVCCGLDSQRNIFPKTICCWGSQFFLEYLSGSVQLVVPALWMSPINFSPLVAIHLSPNVAGGVSPDVYLQFSPRDVRLFGCLSSIVSLHLLLVWLVACESLDVCLQQSPFSCVFQPCGGVQLSTCLSFMCLRSFVSKLVLSSLDVCRRLSSFMCTCLPSFVSQSGSWCPALRMSLYTCFPSFVSRSGWRSPAPRVSVFTCLLV